MSKRSGAGHSAWRWPTVLALLTMGGLLTALLGNGESWKVVAWCALAAPVAVAVLNLFVRRRS